MRLHPDSPGQLVFESPDEAKEFLSLLSTSGYKRLHEAFWLLSVDAQTEFQITAFGNVSSFEAGRRVGELQGRVGLFFGVIENLKSKANDMVSEKNGGESDRNPLQEDMPEVPDILDENGDVIE